MTDEDPLIRAAAVLREKAKQITEDDWSDVHVSTGPAGPWVQMFAPFEIAEPLAAWLDSAEPTELAYEVAGVILEWEHRS